MSETTIDGATAPAGKIRIGGVLSRTFSVLFGNILTFLVIAFVIELPLLVFNLAAGGGMAVNPASAGPSYFIGLLLSFVLTYLAMGAVVYGTVTQLRGQPAGLGECLSRGLSSVLPVFLVAVVVTVLLTLGVILLVVPGIIVMVMTAVAVQAAVVERPGVWASVKRSAELTKGNRWRVFGLLIIFYVALMGVGWALGLAGLPILRPDGTMTAMVSLYIWNGVTTAFFSVFGAVMYHDLRVAKEGVSAAQIAAVFD